MKKKLRTRIISGFMCGIIAVGMLAFNSAFTSEAVNVTRGGKGVYATMSLTRLSNGKVKNGRYHSHKYGFPQLGSFACSSKRVYWGVTNVSYNMTLGGMIMVYADKDGAYRYSFDFYNYM